MLGEFQTLVNPDAPIPPFIAVLTGITDAMVAGSPRMTTVLPAFLEFARGSVLVAHNAGFDISFLRASAAATGQPWPAFRVLDTVHLARQVVTRDEARNHKLATLAQVFHSPVTPDHRALTDAQATVHVLHGLLERVGSLGVTSIEELRQLHLAGHPAAAPQALPRRRPAVRARGLRLPRRPRPRRSTSARRATSGPGSAPTSPPPSSAPGWPRWSASPSASTPSPAPPRSRPRSASCG